MAQRMAGEHLCPVEHVRPVVACLPRAAGALDALLTADRADRSSLYRAVASVGDEVEAARVAAMASLSQVRPTRRARGVRLAQSAALLVGIMVAVGRVAAEGVRTPIPPTVLSRSRDVVQLCEDAMPLVLPTQRGRLSSEEVAWEQGRLYQLDAIVTEVSAVLDDIMVDLVGMAAAEVG